MAQSSSVSRTTTWGALTPPVRVPKLKVRVHVGEIAPEDASKSRSAPAVDSSDHTAVSRFSSSTSTSNASFNDVSANRVSTNASGRASPVAGAVPKKKRSGWKSLFGVKEPSTAAFFEYAEQQKKVALLRGGRSSASPGFSSQKLPDFVPKVNSKWDGMPTVAHEPARESQWKKSSDTLRRSKSARAATTNSTAYTSVTSSRVASQNPSGRSTTLPSRSGTARSSIDRRRGHERPNGHLNLFVPPEALPPLPTLDLPTSPTGTASAVPSQLQSGSDNAGEDSGSTETLKDAVSTSSATAVRSPQSIQSLRRQKSDSLLPIGPPQLQEHHASARLPSPSRPPRAVPEIPGATGIGDVTAAKPRSLHQRAGKGASHDGVISIAPSDPPAVSEGNREWPLSPVAIESVRPAPPIDTRHKPTPVRAPVRRVAVDTAGPPARTTSSAQSSPEAPRPALPKTPSNSKTSVPLPRNFARPSPGVSSSPTSPSSPLRQSPRNFARPFASPADSPSESASVVRQGTVPDAASIAGPSRSTALRPPAAAIGRPVTKDTALEPIIEVDGASIISVAVEPLSAESDRAQEAEQTQVQGSVTNGRGDEDESEGSLQSGQTTPEALPRPQAEANTVAGSQEGTWETETAQDADAVSVAASEASVASAMSDQWYQSPKERLGLGGFIKHDRDSVPWPTGIPQQDAEFLRQLGESRTAELSSEEKKKNRGSRGSLSGIFKRQSRGEEQ